MAIDERIRFIRNLRGLTQIMDLSLKKLMMAKFTLKSKRINIATIKTSWNFWLHGKHKRLSAKPVK